MTSGIRSFFLHNKDVRRTKTSNRSCSKRLLSHLGHMVIAVGGACYADSTWESTRPPASSPARKHETRAESLYRHGCNCMDVLERQDCAIKYFEQLVDLDDGDRRIMGDALFRLAKLYRQRGDEDEAVLLLRKFWRLGTRFKNRESLPYATKYVPAEMDILTMFDVAGFQQSQFYRSLNPLVQEYVFTCDESRRKSLELKLKKHSKRKDSSRKTSNHPPEIHPPIFSTSNCQLARAFLWSDYRQLQKFVHAMNHRDTRKSLAIYKIDNLSELLKEAEEGGRLKSLGEQRWEFSGFVYDEQPVVIHQIDGDNLVLARKSDMQRIQRAHEKKKKTLQDKLQSLSARVPSDATMLAVASDMAMRSGMEKLGFIGKLLPDPEGLMLAVVVHQDAGIFIRLPTTQAIKSQALVGLLRYVLEGAKEPKGGQISAHMEWFENLDVSQDSDDQALILSNWIGHQVIENLILGVDS